MFYEEHMFSRHVWFLDLMSQIYRRPVNYDMRAIQNASDILKETLLAFS